MDALELLVNRRSASRLAEPAPTGEQLDNIIRAGMRAPDHGTLQPWQFSLLKAKVWPALARRWSRVLSAPGWTKKAVEKARTSPSRAPMIIAVVAKCEENPKVPQWEQLLGRLRRDGDADGGAGPWFQRDLAYRSIDRQPGCPRGTELPRAG